MELSVDTKRIPGNETATYVVKGATLECSWGSHTSELQIPIDRKVLINDIKQANIDDHVGGENIMSFGLCARGIPRPPCIMATSNKWVRGKDTVHVEDEPALLDISVNFCDCGGVVSVVKNGHG